MSTTNVTTVSLDSAKATTRTYRDQRRSTGMSSQAASPTGIVTAATAVDVNDFKGATSLHMPHRFITSQNPEDIVASRYLQRLGNTFVRRASPDAVEKAAAAVGGRTASFRSKRGGTQPTNAATASLAAVHAAPSPSFPPQPLQHQQGQRGEDGASATRRWRTQVATSDVPTSPPAPPPPLNSSDAGSAVKPAIAAGGVLSQTRPASEAALEHTGSHTTPPDPGRLGMPRRHEASSQASSVTDSVSSQAAGGLQQRRRPDGGDTSSSDRTADAKKKILTETAGNGAFSGSHSSTRGTTNRYNEAALQADTAVRRAAALVASGVPAPRKVRTEEERSALVVAQEHAKLMLLVGRRANLEADIEDALEIAETCKDPRDVQRFTNAVAAPAAASSSDTTNATSGRAQRKRGGSIATKADADVQLSAESGAVRRRMRQLLTNLLGTGVLSSVGGETTLDAANLNRLVQQLQAQLDVVEGDLVERLEAEAEEEEVEAAVREKVDSGSGRGEIGRMRAVSTTSSAAAAMQASPAQTVLQRRKRALQQKQIDLRDISSNQEQMEWIMESVDAELITEVPAEWDAVAAVEGDTAAADPARQPLLPASFGNSARTGMHESILNASRERRTSKQETFSPVLVLSPHPREPELLAADSSSLLSRTTTRSHPSMVPFSLSDSASDDDKGDSVTRVFQGSKHDLHRPAVTTANARGLNLLRFMEDVLDQYQLDAGSTSPQSKRRPLTAPSKGGSSASRLFLSRSGMPQHATSDVFGETDSAKGNDGSAQDGFVNPDSQETASAQPANTLTSPRSGAGAVQGNARGSAGRRQQLFGDNRSDGRGGSIGGSILSFSNQGIGASTSLGAKEATLLGTQLRNLRTGLLQDLRELGTLYDYMHLIDERRRQLNGGSGEKGEDAYEAELERKLAEHRLQQESLQRARDEALRRKAEGVELDAFGTTSGAHPRQSNERPAPHSATQQPVPLRNITSAGANPAPLSERLASAATDPTSPLPGRASTATAVEAHAAAVETTTVAEVETVLSRESVDGGQLFFTLVGFSVPSRVPTATDGRDDVSVRETSKKKKAGASSNAAATDNFIRYELRVERELNAPPPLSSEEANEENTLAPLFAVVKINPRRLLNLKLTTAEGASMQSKDKMTVVTATVKGGAPPQSLLSLVPVKRYKASSFAKAFEYSAATEAAAPEAEDVREGSTASMPFTFPSPGGASSRSASLDSRAVLPASPDPLDHSETAAIEDEPLASSTEQRGASHTKRGKSSPAGDKKGATTTQKSNAAAEEVHKTSMRKKKQDDGTAASVGVEVPAKAQEMKSGSLPPIRQDQLPPAPTSSSPVGRGGVGQRGSASGVLPAATTPHSGVLALPTTPPMQEDPRPVEEWGVPHPHPEMEAVEKNAVVLTVLWAEEEELPWLLGLGAEVASTPRQGGQASLAATPRVDGVNANAGSAILPAEALLATIPDHESSRPASGAINGAVAEAKTSERVPSASAIDKVATELLRQVLEQEESDEDDDTSEHVAETDVNAVVNTGRKKESVRTQEEAMSPSQKGDHIGDAALAMSVEAVAAEEAAARKEGEDGKPTSSSRPASSTTPPAQKTGRQKKSSARSAATAGAPHPLDAAPKSGALPPKTASQPTKPPGTKPAPSLTITSSQSRPMRAEEAQQYGGGLFHLDMDSEEESGATPDGEVAAGTDEKRATASAEAPLRVSTGTVEPASRRRQPQVQAQAVTTPIHNQSGAAAENAVPLPPPVVVKATAGSAKVQVLLPQEAVNSSLGPQVKSAASSIVTRQSWQSSGPSERRLSLLESATPGSKASAEKQAIAEQFSVLPTRGAAAEAAADIRTVAHVQTFLQAVMHQPSAEAKSGTGGKDTYSIRAASARQADTPYGASSSTAGGMGVLRSEVDELQEEARQLFMLDPVRYDAVVSELMQQATEELRRELGRGERGTGNASALSPSAASVGLPPMVASANASHASGNGGHHSPQLSITSPREPEQSGDAAQISKDGRAPPNYLSSPIPNPNAQPTQLRRRSNANDSTSVSLLFNATADSPSSPREHDNTQGRLPSFTAPRHSFGQRNTHALLRQTDTTYSKRNFTVGTRRVSHADAVAEVERILYEQMKAKLLLRTIIEKMQALWEAKKRDVKEKNRGRAAKRMRRALRGALAASWPIERQRVINLRKLIYLLDRRVGRVHGWLPHYSDTNVLMTAPSSTMISTFLSTGTQTASKRTFTPLSTWYRGKTTVGQLGDDSDSADGTSGDVCPRYLKYLPQRRMYHYVRLAKSRRLMPLQLVRADMQQCHSRHILLGYEKVPLREGEGDASGAGPINSGWPRRDLPRHNRLAQHRRGEFVPDRFENMQTRGERERYRRRLQGTAAFQSASKMFSPRTRQDADLPFALH